MVLIHFLHSLYKEERNFSLRGIQSIFHQSTCQSYNAKIADFHETVLPGPTDLPSLVFCVASFPLSLSRYTYKHMYYICLYLYLSTERMYNILVLSRGPGSIYFPKNTFKYILLVNFQPTGARLPLTHQWSTSISGLLFSPKILTSISKPQWLKLNISENKTCYLPPKPILLYSSSVNSIFVNTNVVNLASQTLWLRVPCSHNINCQALLILPLKYLNCDYFSPLWL